MFEVPPGRSSGKKAGTSAPSIASLREDLLWLSETSEDVRSYSYDAVRVLRSAVPSDGFCVLTLDPATMLPTGEVIENGLPPEAMARMAEIEVGEQDFNKFPALARAPRPAATLSDATGGDLDRSLRHRELRRPSGLGDELRAALVAESVAWGGLTLEQSRRSMELFAAEVAPAFTDSATTATPHGPPANGG